MCMSFLFVQFYLLFTLLPRLANPHEYLGWSCLFNPESNSEKLPYSVVTSQLFTVNSLHRCFSCGCCSVFFLCVFVCVCIFFLNVIIDDIHTVVFCFFFMDGKLFLKHRTRLHSWHPFKTGRRDPSLIMNF